MTVLFTLSVVSSVSSIVDTAAGVAVVIVIVVHRGGETSTDRWTHHGECERHVACAREMGRDHTNTSRYVFLVGASVTIERHTREPRINRLQSSPTAVMRRRVTKMKKPSARMRKRERERERIVHMSERARNNG